MRRGKSGCESPDGGVQLGCMPSGLQPIREPPLGVSAPMSRCSMMGWLHLPGASSLSGGGSADGTKGSAGGRRRPPPPGPGSRRRPLPAVSPRVAGHRAPACRRGWRAAGRVQATASRKPPASPGAIGGRNAPQRLILERRKSTLQEVRNMVVTLARRQPGRVAAPRGGGCHSPAAAFRPRCFCRRKVRAHISLAGSSSTPGKPES
jgi:hypothetical protein